MFDTIKLESRKLFQTKSFWILVAILTSITAVVGITRGRNTAQLIKSIYEYGQTEANGYFTEATLAFDFSLYNIWIGSITGDLFFTVIFYYILPLAACLPFSLTLLDETRSGYLRQMSIKKGQTRYYLAKYIVTFFSGFLIAVIPLIVNIIITACYVPAYTPDPLDQIYSSQYFGRYLASVFYSKPFLFVVIFTLLPGVFCGLWADLIMSISLFVHNKFAATIIPYVSLFFEKSFFDALFANRTALDLSPFYFLRGNSNGNIVIVIFILITLLILTLSTVYLRGRNDDVF